MNAWRLFIRVIMWQACIFWTCNNYKTKIEWKINSLIRRKKNRDILRYEFCIAIRYKFFVYCDIPIYRYIVTPLRITAFPLHLSSWNFTCRLPMRQECALSILRTKGQRSRSQCINYWKWFPAHNCFPFTPIIMKLHMQTHHEARMCPIYFEVKRSKVKVTMHKLLKMVSGI